MRTPHVTRLSGDSDNVRLALEITQDLDAFDGHFPGQPILPGVAQLDWTVRLARIHFAAPELAATEFQIKFRKIIRPQMKIDLALHWDRPRRRLSFTFHHGEDVMSSGVLRLGVAP